MSSRPSPEGESRGLFTRSLLFILPIALVLAAVGLMVVWNPANLFTAPGGPVEEIVFQKVVLEPDLIRFTVANSAPVPATISQVLVDEAYWEHRIVDGPRTLERLDTATIELDYPWVPGEDHNLVVLLDNGATFEHTIVAASATPSPGIGTLAALALVGLLVGVFPVALGMLWFPQIQRMSSRWLTGFLGFTLGLLAFLLVDTLAEALEVAEHVLAVDGPNLVAMGAIAAFLAVLVTDRLRQPADGSSSRARDPAWLALAIAVGIGLHNLGEGLAIGSAYALGEVSLGMFLFLGFALHNITEGPAILAPLKERSVTLRQGTILALVGGLPAVLGTWIGGVAYTPLWAALFLSVAAGAIAVVLVQVGEVLRDDQDGILVTTPAAVGFLVGFLVMLVTGALVAL